MFDWFSDAHPFPMIVSIAVGYRRRVDGAASDAHLTPILLSLRHGNCKGRSRKAREKQRCRLGNRHVLLVTRGSFRLRRP